jgi:hypothetical protein
LNSVTVGRYNFIKFGSMINQEVSEYLFLV